MADNTDRLARTLKGRSRVKQKPLERRIGEVTSVDPLTGNVGVKLGGDDTPVPDVPTVSNYMAQVGDVVNVDVKGADMVVIDRIGAQGPSVFSGIQSATVNTTEFRSGTGYADLTTPGPAVTVTVSPSGRLWVLTSAIIQMVDNDDGGAYSVALSGANVVSASSYPAPVAFFGSNADSFATMTRSTVLENLSPGSTTLTMKYQALNGLSGANFLLRNIIAIPI